MSGIIHNLVETVLGAPAWLVYLLVGAVVFAEDALFVGFVLPGETLAIIGGVTASVGHTSLPGVLAVVIGAAVIGDSVGFEIGRVAGPRVLAFPLLDRHRHRLESAQDFLRRRGGSAVFLGRWTAFFRAVMPALAGLSRMKYRVFLPWNAIGGIAWGTTAVTAGYLAGQSYQRVEKWLGQGAAAVVGLIVLAAIVGWVVRRRRAERAAEAEPGSGGPLDDRADERAE
jgi:membrane protein DedA with SNARE-associated domain